MIGGAGSDTASYQGSALGVDANLLTGLAALINQTDVLSGIENLIGSDLADVITGDAQANRLEGRGGNDVINGGGGDDTIEGGSGADTLSGGLGHDTLSYASAPAGVTVTLPASSVSTGSASDGHGSLDVLQPGTADALIGGAFADNLTGSAVFVTTLGETVGHDEISGGAGPDTLAGLGGNDWLSGDDGNDLLLGGEGDDTLKGGAGNDTLDGGAGSNLADYQAALAAVNVNLQTGSASDGQGGTDNLLSITRVLGSNFADTLLGNDADNEFTGFAGNDTINGGNGFDSVRYDQATGAMSIDLLSQQASGGNEGQDSLISIEAAWGGAFNDSISGNRADNWLVGGAGNDSLSGSDGNDTLEGGLGNDVLRGDAGSDWAAYWGAPSAVVVMLDLASGNGGISSGGAGSDTFIDIENLSGSDFNDTLTGSAGDNQLDGRAGNDSLSGGDGNDTLSGGSGDDSLSGGNGNDNLSGGAGDDTLRGGTGNDSVLGNEGADQIRADAGNDTLDGGLILDRANYTDGNTLTFADANAGVTLNLSGISGDGSVGQGTAQDGFGGTDIVRNLSFIVGSGYDDLITGSAALVFEQFEGGSGNDTIDGGAITDPIFGRDSNRANYTNASYAVVVDLAAGTASGGAGNDTLIHINQLRGSAYNDSLFGTDSSAYVEQFEGRAGNDTIDGRGGIDVARYDNAPVAVLANLSTGVAFDGYGSTDTLINIEGLRGSNFNDWLIGGLAANGTTAIGDPTTDGLERFEGDEGDDTIDGGQGFDRADYTIATAGVVATLGGTAGPGSAQDGQGGTDTLISIEGLRGGRFDDVFTGSDSAAYESFEPRAGNDTVDGRGGIDRIDYFSSELSGVVVDLALGSAQDGFGNTDTLRNIEWVRGSVVYDDVLRGNAGANRLEGVGGNDRLEGRDGNDTLVGGDGNDTLSGGNGLDVAVFTGTKNAYALSKAAANFNVNGGAGNADVLDGVERLRFDDAWVAIDLDGNAGTVAKILGAVFGAASVANQTYFGIGLFYIDGGMSYEALMQLALDARLGAGPSHTAVVTLLYTNVVGVPPDAAALANFVGLLDRHEFTPATLGILAADFSLNLENINLVGLANTGVEFIPLPGA